MIVIPIVPVPAFPSTATQLRVSDGHVSLGVGANFQYELLDATDTLVSQPSRNALTDTQYNSWGADDTQVAKWVAQNLGLTPA